MWLSREEYRAIPRAADSFEHEIAIRLMGDCGLRVTEVLGVTPSDIARMDDGRHYELEVTNGKDRPGATTVGSNVRRGYRLRSERRSTDMSSKPIFGTTTP
ncbi:hypothetical protein [Haladaptatus sp. R4]|uniref:hypothetical protein n=1 Tax=Haladaptatus sp. R4 TaxID=1679489 RepID=UPI001CBCF4A8|nr:hypothetical protein [Haladaptatus sp. R4]